MIQGKSGYFGTRRGFLSRVGAVLAASALPGMPKFWPLAASSAEFPFELVPPEASGITWAHHNGRSPEMYLPETIGAGCAFLDYDNDGWMDIYLVNSGQCDFLPQATPSQRALPQQSRRHLHRRHRKGRRARRRLRDGRRGRRLRRRWLPRPSRHAIHGVILYHNNGDGTFTDVTEKPACDRGMGHQRGVVRLRQRWQARSFCLQLRGLRQVQEQILRQPADRGAVLLHPARLQAHAELAVPQQRRRHVHRRQPGVRHRQVVGQGLGRGRHRHQQRRTDGPLRGQRHGGNFSFSTGARANSTRSDFRPMSASAPKAMPAPAWAWTPPT